MATKNTDEILAEMTVEVEVIRTIIDDEVVVYARLKHGMVFSDDKKVVLIRPGKKGLKATQVSYSE